MLTNIDKKVAASRAIRMLEIFRGIDPEMTMGAAVSFLLVASHEGISITDLHRLGGFSTSSASRYAGYLGGQDRHNRPGKELIEHGVGDADPRSKALKPTSRGDLLMEQVGHLFKGW